jgi:hypothetical protein
MAREKRPDVEVQFQTLLWPEGVRRTEKPSEPPYWVKFEKAFDTLKEQLRKMQVADPIITWNLDWDSPHRASLAENPMEDAGVVIYFKWKNKNRFVPCDKWNSIIGNMRACTVFLQSVQLMEMSRINSMFIDKMLDAVLNIEHFKLAVPSKQTTSKAFYNSDRDWLEILEINDPLPTSEEIQNAYNHLARRYHPDVRTDDGSMAVINRAREIALEFVRKVADKYGSVEKARTVLDSEDENEEIQAAS